MGMPIGPTQPWIPGTPGPIEQTEEIYGGGAAASTLAPPTINKKKLPLETSGFKDIEDTFVFEPTEDVPTVSKEQSSVGPNVDENLVNPQPTYEEEVQSAAVSGSFVNENQQLRSKAPKGNVVGKLADAAGEQSPVSLPNQEAIQTSVTTKQIESQKALAQLYRESQAFQRNVDPETVDLFYFALNPEAANVFTAVRSPLLTPAASVSLKGVVPPQDPYLSEWVDDGRATAESDESEPRKWRSFLPITTAPYSTTAA